MSTQLKQNLEKFLFSYIIMPITSGANLGVFSRVLDGGPFSIGTCTITSAWMVNPLTNSHPNGVRMRNFQRDRLRSRNSNVKLVAIHITGNNVSHNVLPLFLIDGNENKLWINPMGRMRERHSQFKFFYNLLTELLINNFPGLKILEAGEDTRGYELMEEILTKSENEVVFYRYRNVLGDY